MKLKIIYFFLFSSILGLAQKKFEFSGIIKLNGDDKSLITYTIAFTLKNSMIEGFSTTDIGGEHETKNTIVGTYNEKTKQLSFHESQILYTKSSFKKNEFCYVFFDQNIKLTEDVKKIEGAFTSQYKDGKKCINGTLLLVNQKKIEKTITKYNNKIQNSKKVESEIKEKYNLLNVADSLKINYLLKGQNLNVFSKNKTIKIEIWDNKQEDGDAINLYQNSKYLLNNYVVNSKKKIIEVVLDAETTVVRLEATNEGQIKPNTTMIRIIDGENNYELISNLKKWENAFITFIK
jgi:hypothetical protein